MDNDGNNRVSRQPAPQYSETLLRPADPHKPAGVLQACHCSLAGFALVQKTELLVISYNKLLELWLKTNQTIEHQQGKALALDE